MWTNTGRNAHPVLNERTESSPATVRIDIWTTNTGFEPGNVWLKVENSTNEARLDEDLDHEPEHANASRTTNIFLHDPCLQSRAGHHGECTRKPEYTIEYC